MRIATKAEFFRLWEAGVLGNKLRTWRDPQAAQSSGVPLVGFRQVGIAGGGAFEMTPNDQILAVASRWQSLERPFIVCEAAPDHLGTIQGEVCRTYRGLEGYLAFITNGQRMRDSMREGALRPVRGVQVLDLLARYMDPSSRDDVDALLDLYPDATIEFTCYRQDVGCLPARNTIFWEVRDY